jgi:hypothetical protein
MVDDHYLLREAPLRTLQRLKKAELKRLWSVAGLWPGGEDSDDAVDIEAEEGLTKDTLVEGIISAVSRTLRHEPSDTAT